MKLFSPIRDDKGLFEVFKRLSPSDDLLCDPVLSRDGVNIGIVLSPHVSLIGGQAVEERGDQSPAVEIHHPGNRVHTLSRT